MSEHDEMVVDRGLADGPPADLLEAAEELPTRPADRLDELRARVARVRDLRLQVREWERRVVEANKEIQELTFKTLPEMFQESGVRRVDLEEDGSLPPYQSEVRPYYHANIAADWRPERRDAALALLQRRSAGDLIRTVITVTLGRGDVMTAHRVADALTRMDVDYDMAMTVPWGTLTKWVREQCEKKASSSFTPGELETIGARVGMVVDVKPRREET